MTLAELIMGPKLRVVIFKTDQKMKVWLLFDWYKKSSKMITTKKRYAILIMLTQ